MRNLVKSQLSNVTQRSAKRRTEDPFGAIRHGGHDWKAPSAPEPLNSRSDAEAHPRKAPPPRAPSLFCASLRRSFILRTVSSSVASILQTEEDSQPHFLSGASTARSTYHKKVLVADLQPPCNHALRCKPPAHQKWRGHTGNGRQH